MSKYRILDELEASIIGGMAYHAKHAPYTCDRCHCHFYKPRKGNTCPMCGKGKAIKNILQRK